MVSTRRNHTLIVNAHGDAGDFVRAAQVNPDIAKALLDECKSIVADWEEVASERLLSRLMTAIAQAEKDAICV